MSSLRIFFTPGLIVFEGIFVPRKTFALFFFCYLNSHLFPLAMPPCTTVTALEKLAFVHCRLSADIVYYLNLLRSGHISGAAIPGKIPMTTGHLVLVSGAAHGNNLLSIVQAIDTNVWDDEKKLARVIRETLAKAKDHAEDHRLKSAANPADVSASLCRELKDPYVYMPKTKKTGAPKKLIRVGRAEGGAWCTTPTTRSLALYLGCLCVCRPAAAVGPPSALDLAGGPRARPKAARLARAQARAALRALNGADRPGWRPGAAAGGPPRVLVRVAGSGGGGTSVGP